MKSIQKSLAFILALLLLCPVLASIAFAQTIDTPVIPVPGENESNVMVYPFYYSLSGTSATVVGYAGWQTDAAIPETVEYNGKTYTVTAIGSEAFAAENSITSIAFSKKVTSVAANAFNGCTKLTDVWYEGTSSNKSSMSITATGNTRFTGAIWHYSSCITNPNAEKVHTYDNACDAQCNYCDLTRSVPGHTYSSDKDISCDECGYLRIVPGDVDEDNAVTQDDAIHLLSFIFFPERFPINEFHDPDYDKDGDVDLDDVFYLLYHSFFPTRFPIVLD